MGIFCSNLDKDDAEGEKDENSRESHFKRHTSKLVKKTHHHPFSPIAEHQHHHLKADMDSAQDMVDAHDTIIQGRSSVKKEQTVVDRARYTRSAATARIANVDDYERQRIEIQRRERTLAFDYRLETLASDLEVKANKIIQILRRNDKIRVYDKAEPRIGYGGQKHPRFPGDHFLSNVDLIKTTDLFTIAKKMPKGAHLHVHFNACLLPHVLLDIAKQMDRMFITSDLALVESDGSTPDSHPFDRCEIQFSILPPEKENPGNLFSASYEGRQTMRFQDFLSEFPRWHQKTSVDEWLQNKLVFSEEEAHHWLQTVLGTWEKFNGRTRMMKGLFNYESAYRRYTRLVLEDFVTDNIQYAEIRPNFMKANQLWTDDGTRQIDNVGIMDIIISEYDKFQMETGDYFGGLKVIYCTPRSFSRDLVAYSLDECYEFKRRWPQWIAGFDMLGEEAKGHPIRYFIPEFLAFRKKCDDAKLDVPFLFHCGETIEMGNETDGNLVDALLLNSKRIGHGFALARHPYIMEHMKMKGVCLELCPISNEILGLTPRVMGHSMYNLLANNVHCTINSDNGTIFRSTLSHDFYQVMVGKTDMTLHGWRQLIEWSLDHSCMSKSELKAVRTKWEQLWEEFLDWIVQTYGDVQAL